MKIFNVGRISTPNGRSIQAEGIDPERIVEQFDAATPRTARDRRDALSEATLDRHLTNEVTSAGASNPTNRSTARVAGGQPGEPFADDFQARMAHQALRGVIASRIAS